MRSDLRLLVGGGGRPGLAAIRSVPPRMVDTTAVWQWYETAAETNGLLVDMITCACINTISDSAAQATERSSLLALLPFHDEAPAASGPGSPEQDVTRTARFGVFGVFDGAVSHGWFLALDSLVGDDGSVVETLAKVVGDALVYTPLWCIWFLAAFVLLERRDVRTVPAVVRDAAPEGRMVPCDANAAVASNSAGRRES